MARRWEDGDVRYHIEGAADRIRSADSIVGKYSLGGAFDGDKFTADMIHANALYASASAHLALARSLDLLKGRRI